MIERIPISKADIVAEEPWRFCLQVGHFIDHVKASGGAVALSPDALNFDDLWEYHGEVANGGHAQYYENEEDCVCQLQTMQELLRRIGLPGHADLLNEFGRVVVENEDRIFALWAAGQDLTVKALFYDIDDRFAEMELTEGKLQIHLRDWLVQQPWIVADNNQA